MRSLPLLLLAAALLAGCGAGTDEAAAPQTVTITQPVTVTETQPPAAEPECSTSGLRPTLPAQDLPPAVADVRERVFAAALACDYDALEAIAEEKGEGFTFSFGGGEDASDYWAEAEADPAREPRPMRALATILTLDVTRNESGSYAWPSAYNESPTEADWQALVDAGLYSQADVDLMLEHNTGYLGWRTAITPDGDWQFFVAGD